MNETNNEYGCETNVTTPTTTKLKINKTKKSKVCGGQSRYWRGGGG